MCLSPRKIKIKCMKSPCWLGGRNPAPPIWDGWNSWIHGMCTAVLNWWFGFRNHRNTLVLQRPSEIVVFGAVFGVCLHILRRYNWIHRPMKAWGWHSTHPTRVESFSHGELHCRRGRRRRSTAGESCFVFFFSAVENGDLLVHLKC